MEYILIMHVENACVRQKGVTCLADVTVRVVKGKIW